MPKNCFVEPKTIRREVMGGEHWVEIKERLTYYEQERLDNAAVVTEFAEGSYKADMRMDLAGLSILTLETWIVEWSFTNAAGDAVPVSRDAIMALSGVLGSEIEEIVRTQAEAVKAEIDEEAADKAIERHKAIIADLEMRKNALSTSAPDTGKK